MKKELELYLPLAEIAIEEAVIFLDGEKDPSIRALIIKTSARSIFTVHEMIRKNLSDSRKEIKAQQCKDI